MCRTWLLAQTGANNYSINSCTMVAISYRMETKREIQAPLLKTIDKTKIS